MFQFFLYGPVAPPDAPPVGFRPSQYREAAPPLWQEWDAFRPRPTVPFFVPPAPAPRAPLQYAPPDPPPFWPGHETYARQRLYPPFLPPPAQDHTPPPLRRPDPGAFFEARPPDWSWWRPRPAVVLPSSVLSAQAGACGVYGPVAAGRAGRSRVRGDVGGYVLYLGAGAAPDLTQPPAAFASALPLSAPLTPPGAGTLTYHVLVRRRDSYGLESQNSAAALVTIDAAGALVLPALATPQAVALYPLAAGAVRVLAAYPGFAADAYPADQWRVWAGPTPPDVAADAPLASAPAARGLAVTLPGPFPAGTLYAVVGLSRTADAALATTPAAVTLPAAPAEVTAVPGGYDQP